MDRAQRPLSPFWVYRWQITMWLSSLHRITGLLLSAGAVALAAWLVALAGGVEDYAVVQALYSSGWFKVLLVGWTICFFFHLFNGIRHLVWDTGRGFEPRTFRASGWLVIAATVVAGIAFSIIAII
jgi:succinate dehydrogenase / fumarate reductase, cytochrome b subunit